MRELGNFLTELLAVDGGGSKVDAALVTVTGEVLGAARRSVGGEGLGLTPAIRAACRDAQVDPDARPLAAVGLYCLAGADLPADEERIARSLVDTGWAADTVLRNDTFAVLRAGSDHPWGVAVVCGTGINCTAVAPDGRVFRFPAVGHISGDWGGGHDIGRDALWFAVRAEDGRGDPSQLADLVPGYFGLARPHDVTEALHTGRIPRARLVELPPVVFAAAAAGDRVATAIVDRQADEVVTMAATALRRLDLVGHDDLDVVLGGGIFRTGHDAFLARIADGLAAVAPGAQVRAVTDPPLVGAVLLGLDRLGASPAAMAKARETLTHARLTKRVGDGIT